MLGEQKRRRSSLEGLERLKLLQNPRMVEKLHEWRALSLQRRIRDTTAIGLPEPCKESLKFLEAELEETNVELPKQKSHVRH